MYNLCSTTFVGILLGTSTLFSHDCTQRARGDNDALVCGIEGHKQNNREFIWGKLMIIVYNGY